ncbi:hypothetical protein MauCBS54593_001822 [Microsporum audouinii]
MESTDACDDVYLEEEHLDISLHTKVCTDRFDHAIRVVNIPSNLYDQKDRFDLWISNMAVFGPPNMSLDYRLRFCPLVAGIIHQLLDVILDTLDYLITKVETPPEYYAAKRRKPSDTRSGNDWASTAELSEWDRDSESILSATDERIGGTITRLFRISNATRRSATISRLRRVVKSTNNDEANRLAEETQEYTRAYIRWNFPEIPNALQDALVEANVMRFKRLYYLQGHRGRRTHLDPDPRPAPNSPKPAQEQKGTTTSTIHPQPSPKHVVEQVALSGPSTHSVTHATTARESSVMKQADHSISGHSGPKSATIKAQLYFPPAPKSSECPYCKMFWHSSNKTNRIKEDGETKHTDKKWRDHVMRDLEPYICLCGYCSCSITPELCTTLTFNTSAAWIRHMEGCQGQFWECRAPSHPLQEFNTESEYQSHLQEVHDIPEEDAAIMATSSSLSATKTFLECPFQDTFEIKGKFRFGSIFASKLLQEHIATHLKNIALLVLQKLEPGDINDDLDSCRSSNGSVSQPPSSDANISTKDAGQQHDQMSQRNKNELSIPEDLKPNPLVDAASEGDIDELRHFLDLGYDPDQPHNNGCTPLHKATAKGHADIVSTLLSLGVKTELKDEMGQTPLLLAIRGGFTSLVETLLNCASTDIESDDINGTTPLMAAIARGSIGMVQLLLEHGANPNARDITGMTPLMHTIQKHDLRITSLMIAHNADVNAVDIYSETALYKAISQGSNSIVRLLLNIGGIIGTDGTKNSSEVHLAAKNGGTLVLEFLFSRGANMQSQDINGRTPLHLAVEARAIKAAKFLYEHGVNIDAKDKEGQTALHLAAKNGDKAVLIMLYNYGANPEAQDSANRSPLHLAAEHNHSAAVKLLLSMGVPFQTRDHQGRTPGFIASERGYDEVKNILLNPMARMAAQQSPIG